MLSSLRIPHLSFFLSSIPEVSIWSHQGFRGWVRIGDGKLHLPSIFLSPMHPTPPSNLPSLPSLPAPVTPFLCSSSFGCYKDLRCLLSFVTANYTSRLFFFHSYAANTFFLSFPPSPFLPACPPRHSPVPFFLGLHQGVKAYVKLRDGKLHLPSIFFFFQSHAANTSFLSFLNSLPFLSYLSPSSPSYSLLLRVASRC